jgi:hypothetical protein
MTTRWQFVHFDSASANYVYDPLSASGSTQNPYRAQFPMNQTFSKIKRVFLKSLELPVGFVNIRKGSTDTLKFVLNGTTYQVTLVEKFYSTIATLTTDLTAAFVGIVPNVTLTFTNTDNRLCITFTGSTTTSSFSIIDTNLSKYVLGFRAGKDILLSSMYKASISNYNLNFDNYIVMSIPSLNAINSSMSGQNCTFKIPLNCNTNQVYYYFECTSFQQFIEITDVNLRISDLTVILYDKFGNTINPNGLNYSFSICLELWN